MKRYLQEATDSPQLLMTVSSVLTAGTSRWRSGVSTSFTALGILSASKDLCDGKRNRASATLDNRAFYKWRRRSYCGINNDDLMTENCNFVSSVSLFYRDCVLLNCALLLFQLKKIHYYNTIPTSASSLKQPKRNCNYKYNEKSKDCNDKIWITVN